MQSVLFYIDIEKIYLFNPLSVKINNLIFWPFQCLATSVFK